MVGGFKQVKWRRFLTMEADIYHIPVSQNQMGVDPLPEYFIRPSKLVGVQKISFNPSSVNNGYLKSAEGDFYLKSIRELDASTVNAQFEQIKNSPPYWFSTQKEYETFVKENFTIATVSNLRNRYLALADTQKFYSASSDPTIGTDHFRVKTEINSVETLIGKKIFYSAKVNEDMDIITS